MQKIGGRLVGRPEWRQLKEKVDELIKALDYEPLDLPNAKKISREIKEKLLRIEILF